MKLNIYLVSFFMFKNTNLFTILTKILVIILPFYVIIKIFFENKLYVPFFGMAIKELFIILIIIVVFLKYIKEKIKPKFELLDYLIFSYIGYGIIVSLYNGLGFNSLFFGGRYDFLFLIVFLTYKHSKIFLKITLDKLIKLFLYSGSISLIIGLLIKYVTGEEILLNFGYINYISNWQFDGGIPIYHGLDASGLRRFQGILESPNSMAFFLIIFSGLFLHLTRNKLEYHNILISVILLLLVLITYSRSALLGIGIAIMIIFIMNIRNIYNKYKQETITIISILIIITGGFLYLFQEKINNIFLREGSTKGHFERMEIGYDRFKENYLGQGLGTSGPAYRKIYTEEEISKKVEAYYIPESWFIQQLIEGGIIYFSLFVSILFIIIIRSAKESKAIFGMLIAIVIMNIFLHTFESTYNSYILFLFLGIFLAKNKLEK